MMIEPGRNENPTSYRYGLHGMEKDNEIVGTGNSYTTYFRQYDPRLGRWKTPDPVIHPWESPYAGYANNPIAFTDPGGDEPITATVTAIATAVGKAVSTVGPILGKIGKAMKGFFISTKEVSSTVNVAATTLSEATTATVITTTKTIGTGAWLLGISATSNELGKNVADGPIGQSNGNAGMSHNTSLNQQSSGGYKNNNCLTCQPGWSLGQTVSGDPNAMYLPSTVTPSTGKVGRGFITFYPPNTNPRVPQLYQAREILPKRMEYKVHSNFDTRTNQNRSLAQGGNDDPLFSPYGIGKDHGLTHTLLNNVEAKMLSGDFNITLNINFPDPNLDRNVRLRLENILNNTIEELKLLYPDLSFSNNGVTTQTGKGATDIFIIIR